MPKTKVGFTGTRHGLTENQRSSLEKLIKEIAPEAISAHHGCCVGGDAEFHEIVVRNYAREDRTVVGHPPIDRKHFVDPGCDSNWDPRDYSVRNRDIVEVTKYLIACPRGPETRRSGTWSTVRYARGKIGVVVKIVWPDGTVE